MMSYIMFARWFALISILLSLGILFNLGDARRMAQNMIKEESGYVMGGVLPIIFGSLAFMHHHSFNLSWQFVVDIIGLLMLIAGAYRVLFVRHWMKTLQRHADKIPPLFSLFGLMLGLLMLYVGFFSSLVRFTG